MAYGYLSGGFNEGYDRCDTFDFSCGLLKVIASSRQGLVGNEYHIRVKDRHGNALNCSEYEISVNEFIDFTRNNSEHSFVLSDVATEMNGYRYIQDARSLFDRSRLRNCYYPNWW
jgi:hypothetical protein